jgi:hypothetical protein
MAVGWRQIQSASKWAMSLWQGGQSIATKETGIETAANGTRDMGFAGGCPAYQMVANCHI